MVIFLQAISSCSVFFVLTNITSFVLRSHSSFRIPTISIISSSRSYDYGYNYNAHGYYNQVQLSAYKETSTAQPAFFYIDLLCNLYFTIELFVRSLFAPSLRYFLTSSASLIEFVACGTFFIELMIFNTSPVLAEFFSVICLIRLFKLAKHFAGLKVLFQTFRASAQELILLVFFVLLAIVIFATLIYYAERTEHNPQNQFTSILSGLWWALITICTIGYGDKVPKTFLGMLVGALCALMGVLTIALPVPVIVANFSNLYSHAQARSKLPKKRRRVLQLHEVRKAHNASIRRHHEIIQRNSSSFQSRNSMLSQNNHHQLSNHVSATNFMNFIHKLSGAGTQQIPSTGI